MNSHADKQATQHRPSSEHLAARRVQIAVESDANASGLQEAAYNSPQVQQFKAYQSMANGSLQARQFRTMQHMANESVQKKSEASSALFAINHGQPLQRVVALDDLEQKLAKEPGYGGTIDDATPWATANEIGAKWVGDGAQASYYGTSGWPMLTSARRQYRPPMLKQGGAMKDSVQANYEAKGEKDADFTFNAHVTISDLDKDSLKLFRDKAKKDYEDAREARRKAEEEAPKKDDDDDEEDGGSLGIDF